VPSSVPIGPRKVHARPDVSPELGAVVLKALSKHADDRFADVRALASALLPFAKLDPYVAAEVSRALTVEARASASGSTSVDAQAPAPTAPGWSRITSAAAGPQGFTLVLVALAALAGVAWFARDALRRSPAPDVVKSSIPSAIAEPARVVAVDAGSPAEVVSAAADAGRAAEADAGSVPSSVPIGPRKVHVRPAKPTGPDKPIVPTPAPSSNPLHL